MPGLVGRDVDLEILRTALSSSGALILVFGEAGVGKSRLVREVVSELARNRGSTWGRPEQVSTPGPYALIIDFLQSIVDTHAPPVSQEASSLLERLSDPSFALGQPVRRLAAEIRGILSLMAERPIAVFEDLHASDDASLAILLHLARSASEDQHFLVCTIRSEDIAGNDSLTRFLESATRERLATELHLSPLSMEASVALANALLVNREVRGDARRIGQLSEGNPFFIEELSSVVSPSAKPLPQSISRLVASKKSALGPVSDQVSKVASLMWGPVDVNVLTICCELDRSTVVRAIGELIRAGVLIDRENKIVFRHALIREGIREELGSLEVEELNRRIASGIEDAYGEKDLSAHSMALAQHWYWAKDRARALSWALLAGNRALGYAATAEAQSAFELAVACSNGEAPPKALIGLAEVEIRDGRTGSAEDMLARAAEDFEAEGALDEAASAWGRIAWIRTVTQSGDPLESIDHALALIHRSPSESQQVRLLAQKGQIQVHTLGSLVEGRSLLESALQSAAAQNDLVVQAECLDTLAWEAEYSRRSHEADQRAADASRLALESGVAETIGRTLNNRALLLTLHGDASGAIELLEVARSKLRGAYGISGIAVIDLTEAIARWRMGTPGLVAELVSAREHVWAHWRAYACILDSWSAMHLGDAQRAKRVVASRWQELAIERDDVTRAGEHPEFFEAAVCDLIVASEIDDAVSAPLGETLIALGRARPADDHLIACWLACHTRRIAGDNSGAEVALQELDEELSTYDSPYFRGLGFEARAQLDMRRADARAGTHAAIDNLEMAIEIFALRANMVDQSRCLRVLAENLTGTNEKRAIECAHTARSLARESGSQLEELRSEALLRRLGVRSRGGRPRKKAEDAQVLSRRENEIASLVAAGHTNAAIASKLFLSDRTVQDHITHALRKVGARGRAGLAAWAAKNGLV